MFAVSTNRKAISRHRDAPLCLLISYPPRRKGLWVMWKWRMKNMAQSLNYSLFVKLSLETFQGLEEALLAFTRFSLQRKSSFCSFFFNSRGVVGCLRFLIFSWPKCFALFVNYSFFRVSSFSSILSLLNWQLGPQVPRENESISLLCNCVVMQLCLVTLFNVLRSAWSRTLSTNWFRRVWSFQSVQYSQQPCWW